MWQLLIHFLVREICQDYTWGSVVLCLCQLNYIENLTHTVYVYLNATMHAYGNDLAIRQVLDGGPCVMFASGLASDQLTIACWGNLVSYYI